MKRTGRKRRVRFPNARFSLLAMEMLTHPSAREMSLTDGGRMWDAISLAVASGGPIPSQYAFASDFVVDVRYGTQRPGAWSRRAYPAVMARDGARCRYCGDEDGPLAIDHVIPRKQGGNDHAGNLVVSCRRCNARKGARTPEQAGMTLLPAPRTGR